MQRLDLARALLFFASFVPARWTRLAVCCCAARSTTICTQCSTVRLMPMFPHTRSEVFLRFPFSTKVALVLRCSLLVLALLADSRSATAILPHAFGEIVFQLPDVALGALVSCWCSLLLALLADSRLVTYIMPHAFGEIIFQFPDVALGALVSFWCSLLLALLADSKSVTSMVPCAVKSSFSFQMLHMVHWCCAAVRCFSHSLQTAGC